MIFSKGVNGRRSDFLTLRLRLLKGRASVSKFYSSTWSREQALGRLGCIDMGCVDEDNVSWMASVRRDYILGWSSSSENACYSTMCGSLYIYLN